MRGGKKKERARELFTQGYIKLVLTSRVCAERHSPDFEIVILRLIS